ncbi:MAG: hypothetical protein GY937_22215 [bacterium]|nr:hypothetical protein [bacterium]
MHANCFLKSTLRCRTLRGLCTALRLAFTALVLAGAPASAATINQVTGTNGLGVANAPCGMAPGFNIQEIDNGPVGGGFSSSGSNCSVSVSATAGGGVATVTATYQKDTGSSVQGRVGATASSSYEIVLIAPSGYTGGKIPFSFGADVSGTTSAYAASLSRFGGRASGATLTAQIGFTGFTSNFSTVTMTDTASASAAASANLSQPVDTDTDSLGATLQTGVAMIDPTRRLTIGMSLSAGAGANGHADFDALAIVDAANSLTFASGRPAFDLPPGWSVDVADANIFDNVWYDPRAVPEARASWLIAMAGLAACLSGRRVRRGRE